MLDDIPLPDEALPKPRLESQSKIFKFRGALIDLSEVMFISELKLGSRAIGGLYWHDIDLYFKNGKVVLFTIAPKEDGLKEYQLLEYAYVRYGNA